MNAKYWKILQRCITSLLQWVWLDKSLNWLISSTIGADRSRHFDMNAETLERFCKNASRAFFNEFDLISYQINSFNQFILICHWIELRSIEQEKRDKPLLHMKKSGYISSFLIKRNDQEEECLKLLPRHAWLKNMAYFFNWRWVRVYVLEKSDKANTNGFTFVMSSMLTSCITVS